MQFHMIVFMANIIRISKIYHVLKIMKFCWKFNFRLKRMGQIWILGQLYIYYGVITWIITTKLIKLNLISTFFGKNLWKKPFFLNEIVNLEQCYVDLWLLNQHWQHKDSKKQHVSSKKRFHWAKENVNAADFLMMILIVNLGMWFENFTPNSHFLHDLKLKFSKTRPLWTSKFWSRRF